MSKQKIVLIEDDAILSKVVADELKDADFDVTRAMDGEAGLKAVASKKPDLVLLDVILPKKQGFEVLEELKASPELQTIPVIMITMLGRDEDLKRGFKLGAADYIVKSQHAVSEIIDKVKDFLEKGQQAPVTAKKTTEESKKKVEKVESVDEETSLPVKIKKSQKTSTEKGAVRLKVKKAKE